MLSLKISVFKSSMICKEVCQNRLFQVNNSVLFKKAFYKNSSQSEQFYLRPLSITPLGSRIEASSKKPPPVKRIHTI